MRISSRIVLASIVSALALSTLSFSALPAFASEPQPETAGRPSLAEVHPAGTVARYIVGPAGHVRGFMLRDGTVVFTGRGGDKMAADVPVGQTVRIDGRAAPTASNVVVRAKVYGPHGEVSELGGRGQWKNLDPAQRKEQRKARREKQREELSKLPQTSLDGTVQTVLTGRRGNARAVILSNGADVVLERSLVRAMDGRAIKVGDVIHASGKGGTYANGAAIEATELTLADGTHFLGKPL